MSTVYLNARIYTANAAQPWATAMLVKNRKISVVGTEAQVLASATAGTEIIDLQGRMVMPGIHDAHLHLLFSGLKFRFEPRIRPQASSQQIVEDLQSCTCSRPRDTYGNEWIIGGEFHPLAMEQVDKQFLDEAFPENPVFLYDYSTHHGLANTRALELAGIDSTVKDPSGGSFVRRSTGELTGEMVEQARWPVMHAMPDHPDQVNVEAMRWAVNMCHQYGITSVQEASASPQTLRSLKTLDEAGELHLKVAAHLVWREEGFGGARAEELDRLIETWEEWRSEHVDTRFVKIWLDGAPLPPHPTQAKLASDGTVEKSKILIKPDELADALTKFDAAGLTVKIHCAGEGAKRVALDALDHVRRHNGPHGPSHEIAHASVISDSDYPRFKALNVTAEMSPALWHIPEYGIQKNFRFRKVLDHGARMTIGSDWIIAKDPNLFPAVQGMLQHGEQAVNLEEALQALTIGGAEAIGRSKTQGSLEPGKSADFIVLDRHLFDIPVSEIGETEILQTVFEGTTVFKRL